MKNKKWTAEEDEYLKNHYPTATPKELEKRLQRSYQAIQSRASIKGYKRKRKKKNQWTKEKTQFLIDNYEKMTAVDISKELNIHKRYIYSLASKLNLVKENTGEYTEEEDERLLELKSKGLTLKEISKEMDRTVNSVKARYTKIIGRREDTLLDYDKIEEYKKLKIAGTKWNDIDCSNDIYFNYKDLGEAIIINAGRDLMESATVLRKLVDCNIPDKLLKETVEEVLKDESAFFTPIYNLCTKIPGEVMVRKCWEEVGVDRNKYLRQNLHLIS